jgi:hypothetical protein
VIDQAVPFFARALTPPLIVHSISGTPGTNGWYVSDVAVSWGVSDPESPVTSSSGCEPAAVTVDTAGVTFTCSASSAGGSYTLTTPSIKRDATAPTVTFDGNRATYGVVDTVSITCTAADNLSGVAGPACEGVSGPAYGFDAGVSRFTSTATDNAGNIGTGSVAFTLEVTPADLCALTGEFLQPWTGLSATTCAMLSSIVSKLTPAQKAPVVRGYKLLVQALVRPGWLTASEAATLTRLADAL